MAAPRDTSSVIEIPGPWQHRYVAANGARFHVVEAAATPAANPSTNPAADPSLVVLLHGFPEFWWAWRDQLPALAAAGYRAVAMDLRGYGGSDKTPRGYDPFTLAQDVAGVVKALGERSAVVVGHGWGGYIGWAAAALHPREVCGLVAVSAPHPLVMLRSLWHGRGPGALAHVLAMQVPLLPERRIADPAHGFVGRHLQRWSAPGSRFPQEEVVATYQDALSLWPAPHCALEYHRWLVRSRLRSDGRRFTARMRTPLTQPVLMLYGAQDPAMPQGPDTRSPSWVHAEVTQHGVPGAGHFPHEEQPEHLSRTLLDWLASTGSAHV